MRLISQVTQALMLLKGRQVPVKESCPMVFCQRFPNRMGYFLQPLQADPPNPSCYVCNTAQLNLQVLTLSLLDWHLY